MRLMLRTSGFLFLMNLAPLFGQGMTLVGSGYSNPTNIWVSPGQVITVFVSNTKTVLPLGSPTLRATTLPLPTSLGGFSVNIRQSGTTNYPAPLFSVEQGLKCGSNRTSPDCFSTALTLQIPFEISLRSEPPTLTELIVNDNGTQSEAFLLGLTSGSIHVLTTCETQGTMSSGTVLAFPPCSGVVTHADGSLVSSSSPAKAGEVVIIYAVGLGSTLPSVKTGDATPTPAPILGGPSPLGSRTVDIQFDFRPNAMPSHPFVDPRIAAPVAPGPIFAGLTPGQVGLYQINVKIPDSIPQIPACTGVAPSPLISYVQSNLTIDIGANLSWDGAAICVQPGQ